MAHWEPIIGIRFGIVIGVSCSNCGYEVHFTKENPSDYCPRCKSKMTSSK